jgi:4-carboxymuconolactone decarboxylase
MNRPYIVCHMASALDGKITGPFMETETAEILGGEYERINKIYNPDAWLCGRVTTDENFTFYRKPDLDENDVTVPEGDYIAVNNASMYYVSVDTSGRLGWESSVLHYEGRPDAHIIEVLSEKASTAYRAYLRKHKISYITAGENRLDCTLAVKKLKELFNINTLMVSGGGFINWSFLHEGLIDELSLVIMPIADGENNTVTLFEKSDFFPKDEIAEFSLKDVEKIKGDGVWLRYTVKNKEHTEPLISHKAKEYHEKLFPGYKSGFLKTDPEFIERFDNFAFDEVINSDDMDDKTRMTAILSALLGCQGIDEFKMMLSAALNTGVTAVEIKETVYQAVAYLGIGRVYPFLNAVNDFLVSQNIELPLPGQATTTMDNRLEEGIKAQVDIFGENMREFYKSGPEEIRHINRWLAANCFGDYYTRTGLDYKQREMITFCFLAAQGGCEPQLKSHAAANMRIGNDKKFLIQIISQCLPFIGYPRSLNALRCVNEAAEELSKK